MKMMRPIAQAIARAHRFPSPNGTVSIIHRDLKPENIFITTVRDGAPQDPRLRHRAGEDRSPSRRSDG